MPDAPRSPAPPQPGRDEAVPALLPAPLPERLLGLPLVGRLLHSQVELVRLLWRCSRRWSAVNGSERAATIAAKAFLSIVPLVIVVGGAVSTAERSSASEAFIQRYGLNGDSAEAIRQLFSTPSGVPAAFTLPGFVLLLYSGMGFVRALQRLWAAAWNEPVLRRRGTRWVGTAVLVLLVDLLLVNLLGSLLRGLPFDRLLTLVARAAVGVVFWLGLQWLLLGGRIRWRQLVPGAVLIASGQALATLTSALWMPVAINTYATRYGIIGVTFVFVSWLVALGLLLVGGAVLSAELADSPRLPGGPAVAAGPVGAGGERDSGRAAGTDQT